MPGVDTVASVAVMDPQSLASDVSLCSNIPVSVVLTGFCKGSEESWLASPDDARRGSACSGFGVRMTFMLEAGLSAGDGVGGNRTGGTEVSSRTDALDDE